MQTLVDLVKSFVGDMGPAYNGLYGAVSCVIFVLLAFVVLNAVNALIDRR